MPTHTRRFAKLAGLGLVFAITLSAAAFGSTATTEASRATRQSFHDQMRELWAGDHIVWTRCFIVSTATLPEVLPDTQATTDRLLANQTAIGNAIKPFYGDAAGDQLTALLRTHILTAAELLFAAKAGNDAAAADAAARWYANADDIAAFLHDANPNQWSFEKLEALLHAHLDLTLGEVQARLQGRYSDDVAAYDQVHGQILQLADTLSAGIIAQFPQTFAR
jgi:hypothetical protein